MNVRQLVPLVFIFVAAAAAWQVLEATILLRTSTAESQLGSDVARMFGPRLTQRAPFINGEGEGDDRRGPERTDITCVFEHENRYRGLVWFSVFRVEFVATYRFTGPAKLRMLLPEGANIDELTAMAGDRELAVEGGAIVGELPEGPVDVSIRYVSTGQDSWRYEPRNATCATFGLW